MPLVKTSRASVKVNLRKVLKPKYADLEVVSKNLRIKSHRVLLATVKKLDSMMFESTKVLDISTAVPESELQNFIDYLISGQIEMNVDNLMHLWKICRRLDLIDLYEQLVLFTIMNLKALDMLKVFTKVLIPNFVVHQDDPKFLKLISDTISDLTANLGSLTDSDEFASLSWDQIKRICGFLLSRVEECNVFDILLAWCDNQEKLDSREDSLKWLSSAKNEIQSSVKQRSEKRRKALCPVNKSSVKRSKKDKAAVVKEECLDKQSEKVLGKLRHFEITIGCLLKYKQIHGTSSVPESFIVPTTDDSEEWSIEFQGFNLGGSLKRYSKMKEQMSPENIKLLEFAGIAWES